MDAWNNVEIFLRLNGHLPEGEEGLKPEDYQKYCDMVMRGEKCPRGNTYEPDGLWQFSWNKVKELATKQEE